MARLLEILLGVLKDMVFALLALFAAVSCAVFAHLIVIIVGGFFGIS